MLDRIVGLPPALVLALVFLLPALEASAFVGFVFPGEIAVLLGGVLAHEGKLPLALVIIFAAIGAIIGDSIGYEVGRHYGDALLGRLPKRLVKPAHVERGKALIHRRRGQAIFLGRFTAALRVLVPGLAGVSRLPYRSFLLWNVAGGVAWATETAVVGYLAGASYRAAAHRLSLIGLGLLAVIVAGFVLGHYRDDPRLRSWLQRRLDPTRWTGRTLTLQVLAFTASLWVFGAVLQDVLGGDGVAAADPGLHSDLLRWRTLALNHAAQLVTRLGSSPIVWTVMLATVLIVVVRFRRPQEALVLALSLASGALTRRLLSDGIGRLRPPRTDWLVAAQGNAWPSGHTTTAVVAYGLVAMAFWPHLRRRSYRVALAAAATSIAILVGVSRAYLGVHWPSDVLGGWAFGGSWLSVTVIILSALRARRAPANHEHLS